MTTATLTLDKFDYSAPAELYIGTRRRGSRPQLDYRRFKTAAKAIRFAMEQLPAGGLTMTVLEVDGERFVHGDIRRLYRAKAYPLPRTADQPA